MWRPEKSTCKNDGIVTLCTRMSVFCEYTKSGRISNVTMGKADTAEWETSMATVPCFAHNLNRRKVACNLRAWDRSKNGLNSASMWTNDINSHAQGKLHFSHPSCYTTGTSVQYCAVVHRYLSSSSCYSSIPSRKMKTITTSDSHIVNLSGRRGLALNTHEKFVNISVASSGLI